MTYYTNLANFNRNLLKLGFDRQLTQKEYIRMFISVYYQIEDIFLEECIDNGMSSNGFFPLSRLADLGAVDIIVRPDVLPEFIDDLEEGFHYTLQDTSNCKGEIFLTFRGYMFALARQNKTSRYYKSFEMVKQLTLSYNRDYLAVLNYIQIEKSKSVIGDFKSSL